MQFQQRYGQSGGVQYRGTPPSTSYGTRTYQGTSSQSSNQQQQQATRGSLRAQLRDKWARLWNGPAYLEPGPVNRHVLALKSGIPFEVSWSLERMIQVSAVDPDLLRFQDFPGLLDGLLHIVHQFAESQDNSSYATRTATEAMLVLRNLSCEKFNVRFMSASNRLPVIMTGIIEQYSDQTAELVLYALEILQPIADKLALYAPGRTIRSKRAKITEDMTEEAAEAADRLRHLPAQNSPSVRLFPALVRLTVSDDRAILIAAFRLLSTLSENPASELVTSLVAYKCPEPHPIDTAVKLLPLFDAELSLAAIDFIYTHTLIPYNAAKFCARPDLLSVLRLVGSKLHFGAQIETLDITIPMPGTEGDTSYRRDSFKFYMKEPKVKHLIDSRLTQDDKNMLLAIKNPDQRAAAWIGLVYEGIAGHSVTQVELWTAYRETIMTLPDIAEVKTLSASDVIRKSSEVFPTANPSVIEVGHERKFVIAGMRLRDRTPKKAVFACKWSGCPEPMGPDSPDSLYQHVVEKHITDAAHVCLWPVCGYRSTKKHDLLHHVRVHISPYRPPAGYGNPPQPPALAPVGQYVPLPLMSLAHSRYHAEIDEDKEITGIGYIGSLVFRNVARTVKAALDTVSSKLAPPKPVSSAATSTIPPFGPLTIGASSGSTAQSLRQLTQGETSLFDELAKDRSVTVAPNDQAQSSSSLTNGSSHKRTASQADLSQSDLQASDDATDAETAAAIRMIEDDRQLDKALQDVDYAQAIYGLPALVSVADHVVKTTLGDHGLGKVLSEVVIVAEACRRAWPQYERVFGNAKQSLEAAAAPAAAS